MIEDILSIKDLAREEIKKAKDSKTVQAVRVKFLGKKGILTGKLKSLSSIPNEHRPEYGRVLNEVKTEIEAILKKQEEFFKSAELQNSLKANRIDVTVPGYCIPCGHRHPTSRVLDEIVDVFLSLGFRIEEGPEVELDYYNFEALNMPKDHPARDMQDTFYINEDVVLRTHTSPVQVHVMKKNRPPLRVIAPGKVYRCDADVSHTPMFQQIEGFMVDSHITMSDLKGVLEVFIHQIFGPKTPVRFRPSFFPFTEPSAEIDIGCVICGGTGCRVCKNTGWIEILGAGMINPRVFEMVGYDPEAYTGFAFGMGIERITMLKYGIDDIRLFFENDKRFLEQF
ncbi:MAG: phenylalanine--tRNA ligase subunit alpha [Nitrospirae bacterium]|nr:phenylalanine--tRNA ligase subunit alpha [Nitrospirota bacterium]MBI4837705.1 phenylalanine--tRNA ligase subunit alpha [Nitrospirota bacterium]